MVGGFFGGGGGVNGFVRGKGRHLFFFSSKGRGEGGVGSILGRGWKGVWGGFGKDFGGFLKTLRSVEGVLRGRGGGLEKVFSKVLEN